VNTHPLTTPTDPVGHGPQCRGEGIAETVRAATAGDEAAWTTLVRRFTPALRAAARGFRLPLDDVEDVVQNTWLAAIRHIHELNDPHALPAWLLVTARRESLRMHQRSLREVVTDEPPDEVAPESEWPVRAVIDAEQRDALDAAVERLPARQRDLVGTLLSEPDSRYDDIAGRLAMPVGSIGPTRRRALERLRRDRSLVALVS